MVQGHIYPSTKTNRHNQAKLHTSKCSPSSGIPEYELHPEITSPHPLKRSPIILGLSYIYKIFGTQGWLILWEAISCNQRDTASAVSAKSPRSPTCRLQHPYVGPQNKLHIFEASFSRAGLSTSTLQSGLDRLQLRPAAEHQASGCQHGGS